MQGNHETVRGQEDPAQLQGGGVARRKTGGSPMSWRRSDLQEDSQGGGHWGGLLQTSPGTV